MSTATTEQPETYYYKRLEELNSEGKSIWDSIDRPIRPLIFELNRIGLRTKFSCCGFPYKGEEEPKSHSKYPFVVLEPLRASSQDEFMDVVRAFFTLGDIARTNGWILQPYGGGQWHLSFEKVVEIEDKFYRHEDNERGIHDYERSLITIQNIARSLRALPGIGKEFTVVDGNTGYDELFNGEWQIEPKKPVSFQAVPRGQKIDGTLFERDGSRPSQESRGEAEGRDEDLLQSAQETAQSSG